MDDFSAALTEAGRAMARLIAQLDQRPRQAADRTASPRRRAGSRRNRRLRNVPTFASDRRTP